jgi:hypothetical protein
MMVLEGDTQTRLQSRLQPMAFGLIRLLICSNFMHGIQMHDWIIDNRCFKNVRYKPDGAFHHQGVAPYIFSRNGFLLNSVVHIDLAMNSISERFSFVVFIFIYQITWNKNFYYFQ